MSDAARELTTLDFVRMHLGSAYTLELLALLMNSPGRPWRAGELVRELRSSGTAVAEGLARLKRANFLGEEPEGCYFFAPASPERQAIASDIEKLYTTKPISVVKAIMSGPDDRLRAFSDAFKLKE